MNIKFHCSEKNNFKREGSFVRAFSYTDYSIEPHTHDFYEMNIVLGGQGVHRIENSEFAARRGDVFVIPPKTTHAYYNTEALEVYHVLLKKDFIRENRAEAQTIPGYLQLIEIEPFLRQSGGDSMFLHLTPLQLDRLMSELRLIEEGGEFDTEELSALHRHAALKIIYQLSYLLYEQMQGESAKLSKYKLCILSTLEYIHAHFSEKITVDSLAARVYLSRSTFLRSFCEICGVSPISYLRKYRAKKAEELLASSALSKTEIAHLCGFYDLSHMEKSIKIESGN